MVAIFNEYPEQKQYISEISFLEFKNNNFECFELTLNSKIEKEQGNRISYYVNRYLFPLAAITYHAGLFYVLHLLNNGKIEDKEEWQEIIEQALEELDLGDIHVQVKIIKIDRLTPEIQTELAVRIIQKENLKRSLVSSKNNIEISRVTKYWPETVTLEGKESPALASTVKTQFSVLGTLEDYYKNEPNIEEIITNLKVKDFDGSSNGKIVGFRGTVGERREELLKKTKTKTSRKALQEAPDNQPIVAVKFGKNKKEYHYPMAALKLCITKETASSFGVDWGTLLKQTKIPPQERQQIIAKYKRTAGKILSEYGIELNKAINSKQFPQLFIKFPDPKQTELLFGNNIFSKSSSILRGLRGGVYKRHQDYQNLETPIRISFLKVIDRSKYTINTSEIQNRLSQYKFKSIIANKGIVDITGLKDTEKKVKVQEELKRLLDMPTDIVIIGLPKTDRNAEDDVSLYTLIYSTLLNAKKATQFFYEDTLNKKSQLNNILNNVIPGILAKLGNIPFVLKEPLQIADYFIGFDVSRKSKKNSDGTINACASLRLYGKQGNFLKYHLEDTAIEGEEISKKILQNLLPISELKGKTVLIYRDGRYVGKEVENLIDWSKAIESKFILVESRKSQIPRLYNLSDGIQKPEKGLLMKLSDREGILITTDVFENIGLARPLRLTICKEGHQISIEELADATLKLTLLHYGSLRSPRLPVPLFAADEMAYRRLQGIYPTLLKGDKQFWL